MMRRGSKYWMWADCKLRCQSHDEVLSDGAIIDVQSRVSRRGRTQLFIGIYDQKGIPLFEEAHDSLPNDTMTTALAWGVGRARRIAMDNVVLPNQASVIQGRASRLGQPSAA